MTRAQGDPPQPHLWPLAALFLLAGCASTRNEAPPTVVAQPPEMTATEAIEQGRQILDAQKEGVVATPADPPAAATPPVPPATTPPPPGTAEIRPSAHLRSTPGVATRYAPTTESTVEVRERHRTSAPPLDFEERLDTAHDHVYVWGQDLVEATDHKFAKKGAELEPVPAAPFRIGLIGEILDRPDGVDFNLDLDVHVDLQLPNIEKRLRIFVTSDNLDESPRVAGEDSSLSAGLRYGFLRHFDFDVGVKLDLPPVAFTSVRWIRQYNFGRHWEFYPFAKIFLDTKESFGYAAAATLDRRHGRSLLRGSSYVKWRDDRDATEWSQVFIFARTHELIVPDRFGSSLNLNNVGHGWGVRLYVSGEDMSGPQYYETSVFYKKPTKNRWLYWYVEPLVRWDNDYDWHADPGLRIGIDTLFWDLARAQKPR